MIKLIENNYRGIIMKCCKNCFMPDTKPGVRINDDGLCQACINYEKRSDVNYDKRFEKLKKLADKYRREDGYYDCIIPISGGKDSHFQVYVMKELLDMNPLLISAKDPFTKTESGKHNLNNIQKSFGCDIISLDLNPDLVKRMVKIAFEELGSPTWPVDRAIYAFPIKMGIKLDIPFIIYGENVSWEYGGVIEEETYSAKNQINNDVAKKVDFSLWYENGINKKEMNQFMYPSKEEISEANLDPIYLSYFIPWDGNYNYKIAKKYGFRDLSNEWDRDGYIENYDQIDSIGYLINVWMKYPKFGFARATDVVGYWRRSGIIAKEEGKKLIKNNDHKLDQRILDDFLQFTGYSDEEFWEIVDKFWNENIFEKKDGLWTLKDERF